MFKFILRFPLFFFVLALYNIIIFAKPELLLEPEVGDPSGADVESVAPVVPVVEGDAPEADAPVGDAMATEEPEVKEEPMEPVSESKRPQAIANVPLISGAVWRPLPADILLLIAVFVLYVELFKSTRTSVSSIVEHVLSMFVFIAFLVEFSS